MFKDGVLCAAFYEYSLYGMPVFGDLAAQHFFNAVSAQYAVADIVSLSNQQVDLVSAFNEKGKIMKSIGRNEFQRLIPKAYSLEFAKAALGQLIKKDESKKDIFKKFGLAGIGG